MKKAVILIAIILFIDQFSKIWLKTHFKIGEEVKVLGLDWIRIHFIENNGMAWGTEFGGRNGKFFLTLFRLFAITGIGYWLYKSVNNSSPKILIIAIAFIFAGALGNIVDSVFYGVFFGDSHGQVASFLPEEGGYGTLFHGKVVDLFYFPILENAQLPSWIPAISFEWPSWFPFIGGENFSLFVDRHFTFFRYIFNVADVAISVGVGILLFFNKRAFPKKEKQEEPKDFIEPPVVVRHYEKTKQA